MSPPSRSRKKRPTSSTQEMMLSSPTTISMSSNTDVVRFLDAL